MVTKKRPGIRRLLLIGVTAAVLIAGGVVVARVSDASPEATYRTAVVGQHEVAHELTGVASIEPVAQASVAFPVAGTVDTVAVQVGDAVTTGERLGALDTASLQATLVASRASLASAKLALSQALAGEPVTPSDTAGSATGGQGAPATNASLSSNVSAGTFVLASASRSTTTQPQPTSSASSADAALAKAQQAVLAAQKQVDLDLGRAQQALDASTGACADLGDTPTPPSSTTTTSPTSTTSTTTTAPPAGPSPQDSTAACRRALDAALKAQRVVAADQAALSKASTSLDDLLARRAATPTGPSATTPTTQPSRPAGGSPPTTGGAPTNGTGAPSGGGGSGGAAVSGGSPTATGSGGSTTSPSSEELIAYQKAVDAAGAKVVVAEQGVAQAAIVSPIDGTVASVGLAPGQQVTAGSATAAIVVVGKGGYEATTTVTVDDLSHLRVGQSARILPDGSTKSVAGEVVSIGVAADSSGTKATYPVVIGLTGQSSDLRNGALASASITTNRVSKALSVPTSAVTTAGGRQVVTVLTGGKTAETQVQVGVIGDAWTQITSGVKAGQTVVLANLAEPLPGSATSGSSGSSTNGFPAGGLPRGFTPPSGAGG